MIKSVRFVLKECLGGIKMNVTIKFVEPAAEGDYFNIEFVGRGTKEEIAEIIRKSKGGTVDV